MTEPATCSKCDGATVVEGFGGEQRCSHCKGTGAEPACARCGKPECAMIHRRPNGGVVHGSEGHSFFAERPPPPAPQKPGPMELARVAHEAFHKTLVAGSPHRYITGFPSVWDGVSPEQCGAWAAGAAAVAAPRIPLAPDETSWGIVFAKAFWASLGHKTLWVAESVAAQAAWNAAAHVSMGHLSERAPQFVQSRGDALSGLAKQAREACGCHQCDGHGEISRNIDALHDRPMSCLAAVILAELIRAGLEKKST